MTDPLYPLGNLPRFATPFPLHHPDAMTRDVEADQRVAQTLFSFASYWKSIIEQVATARRDAGVS